jgi:hypothetical protein
MIPPARIKGTTWRLDMIGAIVKKAFVRVVERKLKEQQQKRQAR